MPIDFCHGLKFCMRFWYNLQIIFCHFSYIFQAWILSKCIDSGYLVCATPPLLFHADPFQTLQVLLSWSEYMHVIWILSSDSFFFFFFSSSYFQIMNLVIFQSWILSKCIDSRHMLYTSPLKGGIRVPRTLFLVYWFLVLMHFATLIKGLSCMHSIVTNFLGYTKYFHSYLHEYLIKYFSYVYGESFSAFWINNKRYARVVYTILRQSLFCQKKFIQNNLYVHLEYNIMVFDLNVYCRL